MAAHPARTAPASDADHPGLRRAPRTHRGTGAVIPSPRASGASSTRREGVRGGGNPDAPGASAGLLDDVRGARRGRQALNAGREDDIRALRRRMGTGHGDRRADPAFFVLSRARRRGVTPSCGLVRHREHASTAPPRGMSGRECALGVEGGDKFDVRASAGRGSLVWPHSVVARIAGSKARKVRLASPSPPILCSQRDILQ